MRVTCTADEIEIEGDYAPIESLCITCGRCDHEVEVYGRSDASVRRGLVMLRDECPNGESNFYVCDADE